MSTISEIKQSEDNKVDFKISGSKQSGIKLNN